MCLAWLHCITSASQWLQYFKLIFLEIQNVRFRTVFPNPVTIIVYWWHLYGWYIRIWMQTRIWLGGKEMRICTYAWIDQLWLSNILNIKELYVNTYNNEIKNIFYTCMFDYSHATLQINSSIWTHDVQHINSRLASVYCKSVTVQ